MKATKRVLSVLIIVSLILGLLSGCGENKKSDFVTEESVEVIISESKENTELSIISEEIDEQEEIEESKFDAEISEEESSIKETEGKSENGFGLVETEPSFDATQMNSIAMLNYLLMVAQQIVQESNNRLYLEEIYNQLLDNISKDKIDEETQSHISSLTTILHELSSISDKRERLEYLYNQDKADTMHSLVPDPLAILSMAKTLDWQRLAMAAAYTVVDSVNRYQTENATLDRQFLIDGWELDDEEAERIHKNRIRAFNYAVDMVQDYNLTDDVALSGEAIESFSSFASKENVYQRKQFFETNEEVYKYFAPYWLELGKCYYELEEYDKCLECVDKYQAIYTGIFSKDYDLAEFLPKAIVAAQNVLDDSTYILRVASYASYIEKNTRTSNWGLLYFTAQVYMDLYNKTGEKDYLLHAYTIALNVISIELVEKQKELNRDYLGDIENILIDPEMVSPGGVPFTDDEKKEIKAYNKMLEENRKVEQLEVYQPLVLYCELLFVLADELDIDNAEKAKIEGILETESNGVFLINTLNEFFSFNTNHSSVPSVELKKDELIIPAELLPVTAKVTCKINEGGIVTTINDWVVDEVERNGSSIEDFDILLSSSQFESYTFSKGVEVTISISYGDGLPETSWQFVVSEYTHYIWPFSDKVVFDRR